MKPFAFAIPAGLLLSAGLLAGASGPSQKAKSVTIALSDVGADGMKVAAPVPGARATVIAMTSLGCPVAKRYGPELARLEKSYRVKGVRFVFVYPESDATPAKAKGMSKQRGFKGPTLIGTMWARALGAKVATEAFVLDARGRIRYRGAIDDQHSLLGSKPAPRHRYLVSALDAVLAGKEPGVRATTAQGCALGFASPLPPAVPPYYGAVDRIVQANCLSCHREGGTAPFALDSYAATKAHAPMIAQVVAKGIMPPWTANGGGPWRNDRTLRAEDKAALLTWARKGTPKGEPARASAPPKFVPGWTIGKPDAVLELPKPVAVKADGTMPYVNVDVPTNFDEERWVRAIEIVPGDRSVVHHVLVFVRAPGQTRRRNRLEGIGGFFGGYVPGNSAITYADGLAKRVPKGSILHFQIHYTPNGTATTDRTKIGLVFASKPEHEVMTAGLMNFGFEIPPGAKRHEIKSEITTPFDAQILSFLPHAHLRGAAARYEVIHPDGKAETLLDVPRYDFNWQTNYVYRTPRLVKAGDRLVYTAWYDNSEGNPANPDPTKAVHWGEQTFDEMMLGYIEFIRPDERP